MMYSPSGVSVMKNSLYNDSPAYSVILNPCCTVFVLNLNPSSPFAIQPKYFELFLLVFVDGIVS